MECPDCKGSGKVIADHVSYADGTSKCNVPLPCNRCERRGEVPDDMAEWIRLGKQLRDKRVHGKTYRSMRGEAARRGMTIRELSDMEHGRKSPVFPEEVCP